MSALAEEALMLQAKEELFGLEKEKQKEKERIPMEESRKEGLLLQSEGSWLANASQDYKTLGESRRRLRTTGSALWICHGRSQKGQAASSMSVDH